MTKLRYILICACLLVLGTLPAAAAQGGSGETVDVKGIVFGHIGDSYEWHITSWNGHELSVPLPVILRSETGRWDVFMSSRLAHGAEYGGYRIAAEGPYEGKIVERIDGEDVRPLDLSITKTAFALMLNSLILVCIVLGVARWYKKRTVEKAVPKGFVGAVEMFVMMVHDDLIKSCVGRDYKRFAPYLLTVFFFIFVNNLMGLIPFFPGERVGQHRRDAGAGAVHVPCREPVRNAGVLEGDFLARSTRVAQGSRADDAGDRAGRDFHEAVRADDPSVRQHDGRACGDSEPDVRDLRDGQHGGGRECVDDVRVGAVQHIHESAGTAGGVPAGLCLYDAVGRVHRTGAGSARAARGGGNLTPRTGNGGPRPTADRGNGGFPENEER